MFNVPIWLHLTCYNISWCRVHNGGVHLSYSMFKFIYFGLSTTKKNIFWQIVVLFLVNRNIAFGNWYFVETTLLLEIISCLYAFSPNMPECFVDNSNLNGRMFPNWCSNLINTNLPMTLRPKLHTAWNYDWVECFYFLVRQILVE